MCLFMACLPRPSDGNLPGQRMYVRECVNTLFRYCPFTSLLLLPVTTTPSSLFFYSTKHIATIVLLPLPLFAPDPDPCTYVFTFLISFLLSVFSFLLSLHHYYSFSIPLPTRLTSIPLGLPAQTLNSLIPPREARFAKIICDHISFRQVSTDAWGSSVDGYSVESITRTE